LGSNLDDAVGMGYMYILRCSDGSYYVGSTRDIHTRLRQHEDGEGAAYMRRRRPVELVYCLPCESVAQAFWFEKRVQGWSRAKREALIAGDLHLLPELAWKKFPRRSAE
jgi:putative endonuclease